MFVLLEQLHVRSTTFQATLKLDLVLNYKRLAFVVDRLVELGRNGMVGGCIFDNKTLVTGDTWEHFRFFDRPFSHVSPVFIRR